jgi:hypothetical protein
MVLNEDGSAWIFPHRYDSVLNTEAQLNRHGDVYGRPHDLIPPHSNYFRETYSFGGAKNAFLEPFYTKTDPFIKTGDKHRKLRKRVAFCAGPDGLTHYHPSASAACELFEKAAGGAARRLFSGRPLADISVLYGNLLLPGMGAGNAVFGAI